MNNFEQPLPSKEQEAPRDIDAIRQDLLAWISTTEDLLGLSDESDNRLNVTQLPEALQAKLAILNGEDDALRQARSEIIEEEEADPFFDDAGELLRYNYSLRQSLLESRNTMLEALALYDTLTREAINSLVQ